MTKTHLLVSTALALSVSAFFIGPPKPPPLAPGIRETASVSADANAKLKVHLSHAHPLEGSTVWAQIDVEALQDAQAQPITDAQLVLVLDHSGSMQGEKMAKAKAAAEKLIDLLEPSESLAVVAFDSSVETTPLLEGTPEGKERLRAFVRRLEASSGTDISQALSRARTLLAAAPAHGTRRIILVSDGQPTEGITQSEALARVARELRDDVGAVSALGVGVDFNGPLMTRLAEAGGGFYGYLQDAGALDEVLARELAQARHESLSGLELSLDTGGAVRLGDVPGRHVEVERGSTRVTLPSLAPGQTETVYVRLDTEKRSDDLELLATLTVKNGDRRSTLRGHVRVATTDSETLSMDGVDTALVNQGLRLRGTQQMVEAAQAFQRGDRKNAFELLGNVRTLFGASADALSGDIKNVDAVQQRWASTRDPSQVNHEALQLQQQSLRYFGENNAY